ncbi:MAG: DUF1189 domain-containing protein [Candidatus Obscuribacterales bacterium]|nr:DUF1189 domain-containing protein [Candidatus Obscuribacterales bacterium]
MKDFSPFQAPVLSFYSKPFYLDLAKNGKGMGFGYLFLLLLICWTLQSGKLFIDMQNGMSNPEVSLFVSQIPAIKLHEGKLSLDRPTPYMMKSKDGSPMILFDTSGASKDLKSAGGARMLVTQDFLIYEKSGGVEEVLPFEKFKDDFSFDQTIAKQWSSMLAPACAAFIWACGIFVYLGHLIAALLYGLAGLVMDKAKLGYPSMVRLASFAMTPAIMLSVLQALVGFQIPAFPMIAVAMTMAYLWIANSTLTAES